MPERQDSRLCFQTRQYLLQFFVGLPPIIKPQPSFSSIEMALVLEWQGVHLVAGDVLT